jgi:hypothetical protein
MGQKFADLGAILRREKIDEESPEAESYHGFGAVLQAIVLQLGLVKNGECDDPDEFNKVRDKILSHYGWLRSRYKEIDWKELDPEDPDLSLFFKMKERIETLGSLIDTFLRESGERPCRETASDSYGEIQEVVNEIRDLTQKFRKAKEKLERSQDG